MKKNASLIFNTIDLVSVIILYYVVGTNSIFLYVLSYSLYRIFSSCFEHITIKDTFKNIKTTRSKQKIFKYILLSETIISFLFLLLVFFRFLIVFHEKNCSFLKWLPWTIHQRHPACSPHFSEHLLPQQDPTDHTLSSLPSNRSFSEPGSGLSAPSIWSH